MRRTLLLALALLTGCGAVGNPGPRYRNPIREPSGLVASRRHPGVFWTHNDSGDDARLFATRRDGRLVGNYFVENATAIDWEDIAIDEAHNLYVGDIGNNLSDRQDLAIYRIPEPSKLAEEGTLRADRTIRFRYAEQTAYPDPAARNFDSEALFWATHPMTGEGTLYLLTKHRSDTRTVLYRFEDLSGEREVTPTKVSSFDVGGDRGRYGGMVTGADVSADGRYLAILTYHAIFVFRRPDEGDDWFAGLINIIDLDQDVTVQAESIAWDGEALLFSSEQRRIFRIEAPLRPYFGRFPRP